MRKILLTTAIAVLLATPALARQSGEDEPGDYDEATTPISSSSEPAPFTRNPTCVPQFGYDPNRGRNRTLEEYEADFGKYVAPVPCRN